MTKRRPDLSGKRVGRTCMMERCTGVVVDDASPCEYCVDCIASLRARMLVIQANHKEEFDRRGRVRGREKP